MSVDLQPVELSLAVMAAARSGELDSQLDAIAYAIDERREQIERRKLASLKKGDVVRLKGLRPKYVNGMRAVVVEPAVYRNGRRKVLVDVPQLEGTRYARQARVKLENLSVL